MPQGPSANPDKFSPPGPWGAAANPWQKQEVGVSLTQSLDVPFIASATVVNALTVQAHPTPSFIASTTQIFALALDGPGATVCFAISTTWLCPPGYYSIKIAVWGGGGGGSNRLTSRGLGGGGGGAYSSHYDVPVTPGNTYTITVGAAGAAGNNGAGGDGGTSSFTGDAGVVVSAVGGQGGPSVAGSGAGGAGGAAASGSGLTKFSGGAGGAGGGSSGDGGGGGGESGGPFGDGSPGATDPTDANDSPLAAGGTGHADAGDGGVGGGWANSTPPGAGQAPGGGGGGSASVLGTGAAGARGQLCLTFTRSVVPDFIASTTQVYAVYIPEVALPFIASTTQVFTPDLQQQVSPSFIASNTVVYDVTVQSDEIALPFISSVTTVFPLTVQSDTVFLSFIDSETVVFPLTVRLDPTGTGPGNGGETWSLQLAPNGVTETATLAASITGGAGVLSLTGDGPFPDSGGFVVTIDSEVLWITPTGGGTYRIGLRGLSNTVPASHAAGANVSWDDTYLMAVESQQNIAADYYDPAQPLGGIGGNPTIGTDFPMPMPIAFETHGLENGDYTAAAFAAQLIAAGFRSVALQLDVTPLGGRPHADVIAQMASNANTLRSYGLYIIAWSATVYAGMDDDIAAIGADGVVWQVEGSGQRDNVISAMGSNVHGGRPVAAITNYGGIDTVTDGGLLRAAGVTALCVEVYAAEGSPHDDIDAMLFAGTTYGFDLQQMCPTLGTYAGEVPSDYAGFDSDVIPNFGIWSAAQTSGTAYDELEALNDGSLPPDPDTESNFVRYPGWLIAFDASQAYLGGNRYSTHVKELLGVFPPGDGQTGSKLDGPQPVAEHTPEETTEYCPSAIGTPARIAEDISIGDVALCRYTNEEGSILTLGPRATSLQSWYGFKRVSDTNVDVTFTDPDGNIVDGSVEDEWYEAEFITVTLDGDERTFTYGPPKYSNKGWPIGVIGIRHGHRRVPLGTSPDWHDFAYVYSGFCDDCVFVQVLVNRNGIDYGAFLEPTVALPGPQDISGPNATWDVNLGYYTSVAWYVAIFAGAYILTGPTLNGPTTTDPPTFIPHVPPQTTPGPGGSSGPADPGQDPVEGGEWGDIDPPGASAREEFRAILV